MIKMLRLTIQRQIFLRHSELSARNLGSDITHLANVQYGLMVKTTTHIHVYLCLLQTRIWSVRLKDNGDEVIVVQYVLDLVLRVQDGTA